MTRAFSKWGSRTITRPVSASRPVRAAFCSTTTATSRTRATLAVLLALLAGGLGSPAYGARPLLDKHQWDAYFALFARDVYVPWKTASVRLDTYSGAPVDFAAYNVDPADVIVAGGNRAMRPLDTSHRKPLLHWRYTPPPGYRFESNDVTVPLGNQEGFYVVEARRGDAVQQVWLNRTHVGLVTKDGPDGLAVWGVDLGSGRPIPNMNVSFLVGLGLVTKATDRNGLILWQGGRRPVFALAEHGNGRAFVSLLPQAPLPPAIVGVRVESAVAPAGGSVRFAGFARRRTPGGYRRATGDARVSVVGHGTILTSSVVPLDAAGAFSGELALPAGIDGGQYAVLAAAGGGVGGTSLQIDATSDVALRVGSSCPCDPDRQVPFTIVAHRGDLPAAGVLVRVLVVRTPHVVPPGAPEDAPRWGTTVVYDRTVRTGDGGGALVTLPPPTDGLDSTYGIEATTRGASATSLIVVPNAAVALALEPDADGVDVGSPAAFELRGFDPSDGLPAAGLAVDVRLSHGASVQDQSVTLDARGSAHVVFARPSLGSNLAIATAQVGTRRALDAAAVLSEPSALSGATLSSADAVALDVDKPRYRIGDSVLVHAVAPGANGDALLSLDGSQTFQLRLATVSRGSTAGALPLGNPPGAAAAWAALVRNGAIAMGSIPLDVDGPGHARATQLVLDNASYSAGETLHATVRDGGGPSGATIVVRIADGRESGPALFDDAPDVMRVGVTNAQTSASDDPQWHAYVAPVYSKASDIFAAERPRKVPTEVPRIGAAAPRTLLWQVARAGAGILDLPVPSERGHYVLSVLKIYDDGDVGAASASFNVE
jgi:hypothetical protein